MWRVKITYCNGLVNKFCEVVVGIVKAILVSQYGMGSELR